MSEKAYSAKKSAGKTARQIGTGAASAAATAIVTYIAAPEQFNALADLVADYWWGPLLVALLHGAIAFWRDHRKHGGNGTAGGAALVALLLLAPMTWSACSSHARPSRPERPAPPPTMAPAPDPTPDPGPVAEPDPEPEHPGLCDVTRQPDIAGCTPCAKPQLCPGGWHRDRGRCCPDAAAPPAPRPPGNGPSTPPQPPVPAPEPPECPPFDTCAVGRPADLICDGHAERVPCDQVRAAIARGCRTPPSMRWATVCHEGRTLRWSWESAIGYVDACRATQGRCE